MTIDTYTLSVTAIDASGNVLPDARVVATLDKADLTSDGVILPSRIEAQADGDGLAELDLASNLDGTQNSRYRIEIFRQTGKLSNIFDRVQMPRANTTLQQIIESPDQVVSLSGAAISAAIALEAASAAEGARDDILTDAGFIAVATDLQGANTIGTVAGISTEVAAVSGITSEVVTVSANVSNIGTVAGIDSDVTAVAGVAAEVGAIGGLGSEITTLAGISSDITATAAIASDVTVVAGIDGQVVAVAGIASNVTDVAGIDSDVTAVAGVASEVQTLGALGSEITTLAGISADITATAAIASDVTAVANIAGDVTIAADNIAAILAAPQAATDAEAARDKAQEWAESEGQEPGGPGTKSAKEWADEAEGFADSIAAEGVSATPAPDTIPKSAPASNFLNEGWLNPDQFPLANAQDRDLFYKTVLKPAGIDIPPSVLFWPSPFRAGGYEATVARPGTGWIFNEFGVLVPKGAGVLRRDYDPATGEFLGALAEPQREQLISQPTSPEHSDWANSGNIASTTILSGDTSPIGTDWRRVTTSSGTSSITSRRSPLVSLEEGKTYAVRYVVRHVDWDWFFVTVLQSGTNVTKYFNLETGASGEASASVEGSSITEIAPGVYELIVIFTSDETNSRRTELRFGGGDGVTSAATDGESVDIALGGVEEGAFPTSLIPEGSTIRPADTLTLPQVGDRRRGWIAWEGVIDAESDGIENSAGNRIQQFPFGRLPSRQGIRWLDPNNPRAYNIDTAAQVGLDSSPTELRGRLVRFVYFWDADSDIFGLSVDGISGSRGDVAVGVPPDDPIRFGQTSSERQGRSWTNWIMIGYNYPSIAQIEALTGEVAP